MGDGQLILLLVEEHEPYDIPAFIVEDDAFDMLHLVEVALLVMDELVTRHISEQPLRWCIGQGRKHRTEEDQDDGHGPQSAEHGVLGSADDSHDGLLLNAVDVNQIVPHIVRHLPLLSEELEVVAERRVRDVLRPLPHVRRPEELPGRQVVVSQMNGT